MGGRYTEVLPFLNTRKKTHKEAMEIWGGSSNLRALKSTESFRFAAVFLSIWPMRCAGRRGPSDANQR